MRPARRLWIDCDPGHDDAFALVLAFFSPSLTVLGVSTTAGNQTLDKTTLNARRMLAALKQRVRVVKGVARPLLAFPRACPEIHGLTGLDLPASASYDALRTRFVALCDEQTEKEKDDATNGLLVIREALLREAVDSVDFVATGCLTNVALLLAAFPEVKNRIRQLTFLGGAVGSPPGNIAPAAEFNVLVRCSILFIFF
jgi:pyrimidine-specific ribonucleoside hydrolase